MDLHRLVTQYDVLSLSHGPHPKTLRTCAGTGFPIRGDATLLPILQQWQPVPGGP